MEYWPEVLRRLNVPKDHWLREGEKHSNGRDGHHDDGDNWDYWKGKDFAEARNGNGKMSESIHVKIPVEESSNGHKPVREASIPQEGQDSTEEKREGVQAAVSNFASETWRHATSPATLAGMSRIVAPPVKGFKPRVVV